MPVTLVTMLARRLRAQIRCSFGAQALAGLVVASFAPPARAEEETVDVALVYDVEPGLVGCASEQEFREQVRAELGFDPFVASARRRVEIEVRAGPAQLVGIVRFSGEPSQAEDWGATQSVPAPRGSCGELTKTMALVVVLAFDRLPDATRRPPGARASETPPTRPPEPHKDAAPPASPERRHPSPWRVVVGAGPVVGIGLTPGAALGTTVSAGLEQPFGSLALEGVLTGPSTAHGPSGTGVQVSRKALHAVACVRAQLRASAPAPSLTFPLVGFVCGAVGVDAFTSVGVNVSRAFENQTTVAESEARLGLTVARWGALSLRTDWGLALLWQRIPFQVDGATVWNQPRFGGVGFLRLDVDLGR